MRRGRRSNTGSTASLNKHNTAPLHHPTHSVGWLRRRYDAPSCATSMPSLVVVEGASSSAVRVVRRSIGDCRGRCSDKRRVSLDGAAASQTCDDATPRSTDPLVVKDVGRDTTSATKRSNKTSSRTKPESLVSTAIAKNISESSNDYNSPALLKSASVDHLDAVPTKAINSNMDGKISSIKTHVPSSSSKNANKKKNALDSEIFINRGKAYSDASIEVKRNLTQKNIKKLNFAKESDALSPASASDRTATTLTCIKAENVATGSKPSKEQPPASSTTVLGDDTSAEGGLALCRYGVVMTEVHEADETDTLDPSNAQLAVVPGEGSPSTGLRLKEEPSSPSIKGSSAQLLVDVLKDKVAKENTLSSEEFELVQMLAKSSDSLNGKNEVIDMSCSPGRQSPTYRYV